MSQKYRPCRPPNRGPSRKPGASFTLPVKATTLVLSLLSNRALFYCVGWLGAFMAGSKPLFCARADDRRAEVLSIWDTGLYGTPFLNTWAFDSARLWWPSPCCVNSHPAGTAWA